MCVLAGMTLWPLASLFGGAVTWESVFALIKRDWPGVAQMTTEELARRLQFEGARPLLIDTRSRKEFAVSHLPGAVWAEKLPQIQDALRGVPADRPVVLYCSVGVRSSKAAAGLQRAGRGNVFNLQGSIFQWANEGRRVMRGGQTVAGVHPFNEKWGALLDPKLHATQAR
jgi:rhodanese-related sulfurtransferase